MAGDGGLHYVFGAASSGTVVAGDGDNTVTNADPSTGAAPAVPGVYNVALGNGNNVVALESGRSTVSTGTGTNLVKLGASTSQVQAAGGRTTIIGDTVPGAATGSGSDTITAGGGAVLVYAGSSNLTFMGGTGTATVHGAGGSGTVFAGGATGLFAAGAGGGSVVTGGNTGAAVVSTFMDATGFHVTSGQVLVGSAEGDRLVAGQSGAEYLRAGAGNETLDGSQASGDITYFAGNTVAVPGGTAFANTQIVTGAGNGTVVGGSGSSTVTAGSGHTVLSFAQGAAGGSMVVTNFDPARNQVRLSGYAPGAAQAAIAGAQVGPSGTIVVLSDNTRILFQGYVGGFNGSTFA